MSIDPLRVSPTPGRNLRPCPALGGHLKPADCGAWRGSEVQCPPDCPHFPFGTAEGGARSKVLDATMDQLVRFLAQDLGADAFRELCWANRYDEPDPDAEDEDQAEDEALDSGFDHTVLLCATGRAPAPAAGVMARWAAAGHPGLNNDGRQMLVHLQRARVALLEVQRITGSGELHCTEPLAPERGTLVLRDAQMAATTARFSRCLTWIVPTPHGALPVGIGLRIRPEVWPLWRAALDQLLTTARATDPALTVTEYLSRNLPLLMRMEATVFDQFAAKERAELRAGHWFAEWRILTSAEEIAEQFRSEDEFDEVDPDSVPGSDETPVAAFAWVVPDENDPDAEPVTVGEVHVLAQSVVVETDTKEAHDFALESLEVYEDELRLIEERHGTAVAGDADGDDDERAFLDDPHPELDQQTPRAAARSPELRPRLIELVKRHLHALDTARLEGRPVADYGWLLDELGLTELR